MRTGVLRSAAFAVLAIVSGTAMAQVDLAPFLEQHDLNDIKLSPTGEYYAATVPFEDRTALVVVRRADSQPLVRFSQGKDSHVGSFHWVSPTRLVLGMAAALDGDARDPRLFRALPFRMQGDRVTLDAAVQARWRARMPSALAARMIARKERAPVLHFEAGSEETGFRLGLDSLRANLDRLRIPYRDTTFMGGHVDRVRDRFTQAVLPSVGRWFTRR